MHWILAHWELVVPLTVAAFVLVFEVVQKMRQVEAMPLRAYLVVVLLLIAGMSLTMIAQDRPQVPHLAAHLKMDYAEGNAYVEDLIDSTLGNLHEYLEDRSLETQSIRETLREVVRATDRTRKGDGMFAIDYCIPWEGDFSDYRRANEGAVARGVVINRVFIVPNLIIKDAKKAKACWDAMTKQKRLGIEVRFAKESELDKFERYHEFDSDRGMVEFRLGKSSVLMFEAVRYWEAIEKGEPPKLTVTWQPRVVEREEKYFSWLVSPSPAGPGVRDVDPKKPQPF